MEKEISLKNFANRIKQQHTYSNYNRCHFSFGLTA